MSAPYYQDEHVTLYHGHAAEVLAGMEDASVSAVITDPPYTEHTHKNVRSNSKNATKGGRVIHGSQSAFGSITGAELDAYLKECGRLSQGWVVATLAYQHAFGLDAEALGLRMLRVGVWVKTNPMPSISGDRPGQGWESIAYLHRSDVKPSWNGGGAHGNYVLPVTQGMGHPTVKPLPMLQDMVRKFTNPGDVVLDPFAGSGTTLRAAVDEGRRAVGIELEERYCELAAKRLAQAAFDLGAIA